MSKKELEPLLTALVEPLCAAEGFELYDLEFVKEGQHHFLRIFIDKEGGVTINDCETVSRKAEAVLDAKDPISQAYMLEVSSPGLDRALKKEAHFAKSAGKPVDLKFYKPQNGSKTLAGELVGLIDGRIVVLDEKGERREFEKKDVASCRLAVIF